MTRDELLRMFCDDSENRPIFNHPFLQGGHTCATEGHAAIVLPIEDGDEAMYKPQEHPSVLPFLNKETESFMVIYRDECAAVYDGIEKGISEIDPKCPDCKGEGVVEYSYEDTMGNYHSEYLECPICYGSGKVDMKHYYGKRKFQYQIEEKYALNFPQLKRIKSVMEYFDLDAVEFLKEKSKNGQPYHIITDEFHMFLMPALLNVDDDDDD